MNLNEDSLRKIAELSRLNIRPKEKEATLRDFNKILEYVDQVKGLDVSSIRDDEIYFRHENSIRPDLVGQHLSREEIEKFAPSFQNGYFVVPKVIET
ncbi:Asp-tRNA(Asn)/Glu-tRNA(Gln) amidotransferase subunit GatC [Leptospira borgpetersenii]|uniref:Aspartyl/glutamyl-tRNA(Asn/Gln) amidotransferase subunit C n=3 Tax=Leptospira borgpetersenii serovar Hardjo-bovis TaxID=338217 RepID=GATC_LEPBJ|nr:Asp-tRNA(Asn)/Glu-tRNA(Gln) amidotransferase subunit GatC [Leptospira borgpetersenii]Q04SA4.1 RecName: Full=Aspartyl/glutamyl-tRNA(Asn/Gln) amidotransferase subunit C; Short=Asp/Glu-ADT subunit C [Leptospira borgpetersenii serovar Hardjo-bovis str. JB197]Q050D0.1 RecName: Full=Aspartyl/glutamyl-tRNA(Asn/Gln) amidotransferase subunit C; Short=Asp/Glu-ADT subunit C [Leptospira borgpetersenii serovar Hardjo-bovis str. L550]ABJ76216.1 Asp-tRNAAsn/Glu-tRNAGln amidotransferase subunit C [Leptospira